MEFSACGILAPSKFNNKATLKPVGVKQTQSPS